MATPEPVRVGGKLNACCVGSLFQQRRKAWKPAIHGAVAQCGTCGQALEYIDKAWQAVGLGR